nr:hypothetical protein CFP56_24576 [Quercus suber]
MRLLQHRCEDAVDDDRVGVLTVPYLIKQASTEAPIFLLRSTSPEALSRHTSDRNRHQTSRPPCAPYRPDTRSCDDTPRLSEPVHTSTNRARTVISLLSAIPSLSRDSSGCHRRLPHKDKEAGESGDIRGVLRLERDLARIVLGRVHRSCAHAAKQETQNLHYRGFSTVNLPQATPKQASATEP